MKHQDFEAYAAVAARALGLSLSEESHRGVVANLKVLHAQAAELEEVDLPPEIDPAVVMRL